MPNTIKLDASSNGTTVSAKLGDRIVVTLESRPSSGYSWTACDRCAGALVRVNHEQQGADDDRIGSAVNMVFEFEIVDHGDLTLIYSRSWETDKPATRQFRVSIVIN